MAPSLEENQTAGDDYFNDLSQQPKPLQDKDTADNNEEGEQQVSGEGPTNEDIPKPKRIACILCRKRKLKCDGIKPSCGTCKRLQHECSYDTVRKKSGPKRGYVAALEARLAQVETLLKTQDDRPRETTNGDEASKSQGLTSSPSAQPASNVRTNEPSSNQYESLGGASFQSSTMFDIPADLGQQSEDSCPWEMIGLGLDEPLPAQDVVRELNQVYFEKVHPSLPMIQQSRYYTSMNLSPHMRPPVCLRYAMWANAAAATDRYESLQDHFYQRARKYIQQDEMKGHGESMISVAHCQTWCLIGTYEFKLMYFPRAWVSAGRACRLVQMMGMHRLDGVGLDVKQCLPPPRDSVDREERRRTFWMAFCVDRYSSIGTGWPMTIEEQDIMTTLPCDEDSYNNGQPMQNVYLEEALKPEGAPGLSGFSGVILMACMFGRNLTHLHRPDKDDQESDLNGSFWKRHRDLDNILLNTALALPEDCRLPVGMNDPNIIFMNMNIHTSTICLHQAAIFKADKNRMPARISAESKVRCITAAAEIAAIMRSISHIDLSVMNPFISFCLYVAARVFVQYLKSRPHDGQIKSSLHFLLQAMHAVKRRNPLTESFLVQLDVDLEGAGLEDTRALRAQAQSQTKDNPITAHGRGTAPIANPAEGRRKFPSTFGDGGVSKYTNPATNIPMNQMQNSNIESQYTQDQHPVGRDGMPLTMEAQFGMNQFALPNRQRTPGSTAGFISRSPQDANNPMDCSPDGSGGYSGDQGRTPGSTGGLSSSGVHASSRSSNTSYSPQNQHEQQQQLHQQQQQQQQQQQPQSEQLWDGSLFDANDPSTFNTDFEMHSFPANGAEAEQQQSGFVLPQDWSTGSDGLGAGGGTPTLRIGGLMPTSTGGTPGPMNDVINMSEYDWNQVLDEFNSNNSGGGGGGVNGILNWGDGSNNGNKRQW